jgi:hypothetical protein
MESDGVPCLELKTDVLARCDHVAGPRESSLLQSDREREVKEKSKFLPNYPSQWARKDKVLQCLREFWTEMTTRMFGGEARDTPPKRECVEEEFVEGLTKSGYESGMMNTLPNVGRRRTKESNSTGSPVEGGIKPSKRAKEVTCFGSRERRKRYISDGYKGV